MYPRASSSVHFFHPNRQGHSLQRETKIDDLVRSLKRRDSVIPANPGSGSGQAPESSYFKYLKILWTPVSTGVTTFYEIIKIGRENRKGHRCLPKYFAFPAA